ncbi:hypothetical protein Tcan_09283 [Toxocara canis]|uniref:Uncharacterized protein n=1 Tax=Toxocara canis TaxID=6265 RepID=A0A0B2VAW5_TOXCA|nr:hypothetical protein Tcan_09283 [Toxocara canis]
MGTGTQETRNAGGRNMANAEKDAQMRAQECTQADYMGSAMLMVVWIWHRSSAGADGCLDPEHGNLPCAIVNRCPRRTDHACAAASAFLDRSFIRVRAPESCLLADCRLDAAKLTHRIAKNGQLDDKDASFVGRSASILFASAAAHIVL